MTAFETIELELRGPVTMVLLNRPASLNAYNVQMRDELCEAFALLAVLADCRVVVLYGAGRAFCAGADLTEFDARTPPHQAREIRALRDPFLRLRNLPQVTIAAVHGYAIGSGVELALECDLRIATESARFRLPETHLGFIPAAGATQTLPRTVGWGTARDLILRGQTMRSDEAWRRGLVSRVVPDANLLNEVRQVADQLAELPAALYARQALRAANFPLDVGLLVEAALSQASGRYPASRQGESR